MPTVKAATGHTRDPIQVNLFWMWTPVNPFQPKREFQIMIFLYKIRPNSEHIISGDLKYTAEEI